MNEFKFDIRLWGLIGAVLLLLLHFPTDNLKLSTDDYLILTGLKGNQHLSDLGFAIANPNRGAIDRISNLFHFFGPGQGTQDSYRQYGSLVWWSSNEGLMSPFRPVAAFTHWIDLNIFGFKPILVKIHSFFYLLIMWFASLMLFKRFSDPKMAYLASALLLFDLSLSLNFDWLAARNSYMAVGFGVLALISHAEWRESGKNYCIFMSCFLYIVSLLTAEASVALLGYVVAYAVILDRKGWLKGCLAILPYLLITLIWRWGYSEAGFGAQNIGLYSDPGRDFGHFIYQLLVVYPCIVTSLITGVDAFISPFNPELRDAVRVCAWGMTFVALFLVKDLVRESSPVRFMLLGSALAVVPHASLLSAGSRSGTFVAVGFFYVMAIWVGSLWKNSKNSGIKRYFAVIVLVWHLLLPFVLVLWQVYIVPIAKDDGDHLYSSVEDSLLERKKSLVVVNPPWAPAMYYLPFEWAEKERALPLYINALAPGLGKFELVRVSERLFEVKSYGKMIVNHEVEFAVSNKPMLHEAYSYQMLQGLVTTPAQKYSSGMTLFAGQMKVVVIEEVDGVPTIVHVEFLGDESPDQMVWQYFDWKDKKYKKMNVPRLGETILIEGPF